MGRRPNATCDNCNKDYYRRPSQIELYKNGYCSTKCYAAAKLLPKVECPVCHKKFKRKRREQKYCSLRCGAIGSRGKWPTNYKGGIRHVQQRRMIYLQEKSGFKSCMIERCDYNKLYDMHRLISGKKGGQYVIGNMFAICPNHHAEITRGLIKVEKLNDYALDIITEK